MHLGRVFLHLGAVLLLAVAGASCKNPVESPVVNRAPGIRLTAGPTQGSTDNYSIPFQWTAWDEDGTVAFFLYSIDLADGPWQRTDDHTATLVFSATTQRDSVNFTGFHTFYVKAVDNEGAESAAASITFNALTQAPETRPVKPLTIANGQGGLNSPLLGGPSLRLEWTGTDPDGVLTTKPVAYIVTRAQTTGNFAGDWARARDLLLGPNADTTVVPGTTTFVNFDNLSTSETNANWLFWVRAVDEADAVEPWPLSPNHWPGFFFFYFAQPQLQGPLLTVTSASLGQFRAQGAVRDTSEYAFNRPIALQWIADASDYGGELDGFRWGVDVVDLADDTDPGWATGWNRRLQSLTGLTFTDRVTPIHDVVIQARDTNGAVTTLLLRLNLVNFTFDRDVLLVDDDRESQTLPNNGISPTNAEHQEIVSSSIKQALFTLGRPPVVDVFDVFPDPTQPNVVRTPRLADFSSYRTIVWDAGTPPSNNVLYNLAAVSRGVPLSKANPLAIYLEAGGNLVISGLAGARSTIRDIPISGIQIGPDQGLVPGINNFAYDFWHLPNVVWYARTDAARHGLQSCAPTSWAQSHGFLGGYPPLVFNADRWTRIARTSTAGAEALDARYPAIEAGQDSYEPLYTYVSSAGSPGSSGSFMHGLVNAQHFRRAPADSGEDWQYQVVWVGFPLWLMKQDGVTAMLTNSLHSFLSDRKWALSLAPSPVRASGGRAASP